MLFPAELFQKGTPLSIEDVFPLLFLLYKISGNKKGTTDIPFSPGKRGLKGGIGEQLNF